MNIKNGSTGLRQDLLDKVESGGPLDRIERFVRQAFPLCRSITGNGVRQTFDQMQEILLEDGPALRQHEVETQTPVLDWQVPKEWNLRRATLHDPSGKLIIDSDRHNLHVLNYSAPKTAELTFAQLEPHLYSIPEQPHAIPYRTSYYQERWGLCLADEQLGVLRRTAQQASQSGSEAVWRVDVDTSLEHGSLTYGEIFLPGRSQDEILFSAHSCHPSLFNDNLSGMSVVAMCAAILDAVSDRSERHFSYRFLFAPGTIGAITWLARHRQHTGRIQGGLVAANLGHLADATGRRFHYKRSRRGDSPFDRVVEATLARHTTCECLDFLPFGYDERQFCSPGFDLPIGSLTRTPWGQYPEYHTSGDSLDLFDRAMLEESLATYLRIIAALEAQVDRPDALLEQRNPPPSLRTSPSDDGSRVLRNLMPFGEPQLGSRGLYSTLGGGDEGRERQLALLWVLNLSDGRHSLGDIATRSNTDRELIEQVADLLIEADLLESYS